MTSSLHLIPIRFPWQLHPFGYSHIFIPTRKHRRSCSILISGNTVQLFVLTLLLINVCSAHCVIYNCPNTLNNLCSKFSKKTWCVWIYAFFFFCLDQSLFCARNLAKMVACVWASTGATVPKVSLESSVNKVSPWVWNNVYIYSTCTKDDPVCCVCSGDYTLCATLSTWRHMQPPQHLYLSRGHCGPALWETVSINNFYSIHTQHISQSEVL